MTRPSLPGATAPRSSRFATRAFHLQHPAAHLPSHALLSGHALGQSAQALLLHPAVHLPLHSLLFGQSAQFFLLHSDVHLPLHSLLAGHALVQAAPAFLLHSTTQVSLHFLTQLFCAKAVVKENTSNIVANSIILFITCFFICYFIKPRLRLIGNLLNSDFPASL